MSAKLYYDNYTYNGNEEFILTSKHVDAVKCHILFIAPFFAEMNKMRRTLVEVIRLLSQYQIQCSIPDLPGCNESLSPLNQQSLQDWKDAISACIDQKKISHIASFRSGGLIDDLGVPTWRLNAINGANLLKIMIRSKVISLKESGQNITAEELQKEAQNNGIELAGYEINARLFNQLNVATPHIDDYITHHTVGQGIEGSPLWLRTEPEYDAILAQSIGQSLLKWCKV